MLITLGVFASVNPLHPKIWGVFYFILFLFYFIDMIDFIKGNKMEISTLLLCGNCSGSFRTVFR